MIQRSLLIFLFAVAACEPSGDVAPRTPARPPAPAVEWTVERVGGSGFRAFGWSDGDTLFGILRGRLASAAVGDTVAVRTSHQAWGVWTAPGSVSWTDSLGLRLRLPVGPRLWVGRDLAPSAEHTGPDVSWSPDGRRALLAWTAESGVAFSVTDVDGLRHLSARVTGYMLGTPAWWIDNDRALVAAVANAPLRGEGGHREAGYRCDLALLDVNGDSARIVTAAADGEYWVPEGFLSADTVLVGVRTNSGVPGRHLALDTRNWTLRPFSTLAGSAAAAHGFVAYVRADSVSGAEQTWTLLVGRAGRQPDSVASFTAHEIRLLWHPAKPWLALAQESERAGYFTFVLRPVER